MGVSFWLSSVKGSNPLGKRQQVDYPLYAELNLLISMIKIHSVIHSVMN